MPETLTPSPYNDEVEQQIDQNLSLSEAEKEKWWDVMAVGMQEAGRKPAHRAETPLLTYEDTPRQSEPLLEAGEPEPLLEAANPIYTEVEPSPLDIANFDEPTNEFYADEDELTPDEQAVLERALPSPTLEVEPLEAPAQDREPRVPKHAAELHEAQEDFNPDDRVNNLLMVANHIIDRRKTANATGDKSSSADDITAFVELFGQYKAEFKANDVDDSSLELVGKFVTGAYELIDEQTPAATVEENLDASYSTEVRNSPAEPIEQQELSPEAVEETLSRFAVGDNVSLLVDNDELEGGWVIKNDRYVKDPAYREHLVAQYKDHEPGAPIEPFPKSAQGGYHEYTIVKDGQEHKGVREEQLGFVSESAPYGVQGPERGPIEGHEPVASESEPALETETAPVEPEATESTPAPEVQWTTPLTPEVIVPATREEAEEDELGGIDDLTEVEGKPPTGANEVIAPHLESEVSMIPEKSRLNKIKEMKKMFGVKYWAAKWEKMGENPNRRRTLMLAGVSALIVAGVIAGQNNANRSNDRGLGDTEASPFPSTSETYTPSPEISGVTVEPLAQTDQAPEIRTNAEAQDATEYPKGTFDVRLNDGPLKTANRMGYSDDSWYKIAESMNADFPEYFYKAGNDIRYDHIGELPKAVQDAFTKRLKGV